MSMRNYIILASICLITIFLEACTSGDRNKRQNLNTGKKCEVTYRYYKEQNYKHPYYKTINFDSIEVRSAAGNPLVAKKGDIEYVIDFSRIKELQMGGYFIITTYENKVDSFIKTLYANSDFEEFVYGYTNGNMAKISLWYIERINFIE